MILDVKNILIISIALFYLIIGSIEDLKTREVMDYSNFSLIALGFGVNIFYSLIYNNWIIGLQSIAGFGIFVGIAYIMFYAGQWGGGDSKMLMGLGALIGLEFSFSRIPFLLDFFINILLLGAVYGLLWSLGLTIKHWKKISKKLYQKLHHYRKIRNSILLLSGAILIIILIKQNYFITMFGLGFIFVAFFAYYIWIFIKSIEVEMMQKEIDVEKLTEGDWIVNDVKIKGKYICGPKDLGISKEQIEKLIKFKKQNKIKTILIKEGIPFVPSFLFAFLLTIFVRNVWLILLK